MTKCSCVVSDHQKGQSTPPETLVNTGINVLSVGYATHIKLQKVKEEKNSNKEYAQPELSSHLHKKTLEALILKAFGQCVVCLKEARNLHNYTAQAPYDGLEQKTPPPLMRKTGRQNTDGGAYFSPARTKSFHRRQRGAGAVSPKAKYSPFAAFDKTQTTKGGFHIWVSYQAYSDPSSRNAGQ